MSEPAPRVVCPASGLSADGLEILDATSRSSVKVRCPGCGRRVGTYRRRKGPLVGKLTVENHWQGRRRKSKAAQAKEDRERESQQRANS